MRVSRRLRRAKIKKCQPETLRLQLTTPSRRRLRRCRRGCCTEARRRRPARGPAPFPARGWGRCQLGQTPQLSPLRGLSFKRAFKCKKERLGSEKRACLCLYPTPLWLQQGVECGGGLPDVWSVFFSFPLTCVQSDHTAAVLSQAGARSRGCCCKTSTEAVTWLRSLFIYLFYFKRKKALFLFCHRKAVTERTSDNIYVIWNITNTKKRNWALGTLSSGL